MLRDLRSPKGQGLLQKEGPPTFVAKPSIVAIYVLFERLSQGFEQKPSYFQLSTKDILLS